MGSTQTHKTSRGAPGLFLMNQNTSTLLTLQHYFLFPFPEYIIGFLFQVTEQKSTITYDDLTTNLCPVTTLCFSDLKTPLNIVKHAWKMLLIFLFVIDHLRLLVLSNCIEYVPSAKLLIMRIRM